MPIFKPQFNYFDIFKANMVKHPWEGYDHIIFFPDILILRGKNHDNIMREKIACHRISIWGLRSAQIKKLKKIYPHFFLGSWF